MSELTAQFGGDAVTGVVAVNAAGIVLGPIDIQEYDRFSVYAQNIGGGSGDDLNSLVVESAPTSAGPWIEHSTGFWDEVEYPELSTVPTGDSSVRSFDSTSMKYVRVTLTCAAAEDTTASMWLSVGDAS